jgi:(1->4)-alpha-D-glucan 1-alpha-D-glucosylmutase
VLDTSRQNAFLEAFLPFQERVARLGSHNSLVQTTLKLTLPGMPDIYQGAELWDLSLVDPDNRRPVDYAHHARMLSETLEDLEQDRAKAWSNMSRNWRDGRRKLAVTAILLAERQKNPSLFANGGYEPLIANGPKADHICAFARAAGDAAQVTVAARFPARFEADPDWNGTRIAFPRTATGNTRWRDLLTWRVVDHRGADALPVEALLRDLPVAVLVPLQASAAP